MGRTFGSRNRPKNENSDAATAGIGHNTVAGEQLRLLVCRIENMEADKKSISEDIRDVYAEAKGNGFDVKALRAIVRLRAQDAAERSEHEAIVESYMHALGCLSDTPLGQAALLREGLKPEEAHYAGASADIIPSDMDDALAEMDAVPPAELR